MKKLLTTLLLLIPALGFAQKGLTLNLSKSITSIDKTDFTIRSEWRGYEFSQGLIFVAPEFEYRDANDAPYRRYSINVGSTLYITDRWRTTLSGGVGKLQHTSTRDVLAGNAQVSFRADKRSEIFLDFQVTNNKHIDRVDPVAVSAGVKILIWERK